MSEEERTEIENQAAGDYLRSKRAHNCYSLQVQRYRKQLLQAAHALEETNRTLSDIPDLPSKQDVLAALKCRHAEKERMEDLAGRLGLHLG